MKVKIDGREYAVVGKAHYTTRNTGQKYTKIFLEDHKLLFITEDNVAYFGTDLGEITEFNGFPEKAMYNGHEMKLVQNDHQIELNVEFGKGEGDCEYWDYEGDDSSWFVSVAVLSDGTRSDLVQKMIDIETVEGI